jgi:hypothetical protein
MSHETRQRQSTIPDNAVLAGWYREKKHGMPNNSDESAATRHI